MNQENKAFEALFSKEIGGKKIEFVYHEFANKLFLIITEHKNICNFFTVKFDMDENPANVGGLLTIPITITHNFGEDTDECRSAIEFLVTNSKLKNSKKEILFNIGLRNVNGPILREIASTLDKYVVNKE